MSKLKEAVKEYVESFPWKRGSDYSQKYCHDAFIAGAEWQLQQLGHPDPPGEQGADGTTIIKEVIKEKAIKAFNEAMIYYTSPACTKDEEALKYFVDVLNQENKEDHETK